MSTPPLSAHEYLLNHLDRKVKKAIEDYGLIDEGDRILIGLSGGKDSLALVELLGRRSRIFAPKFSLAAAHIRMANIEYKSDSSTLRVHCERFGMEYIERETSFDPSSDRRKTPCFLCSWYRRKALFEIAKEGNFNKIALGHHQDDLFETLLMNMTFQGSFATMPPPPVYGKVRHDDNPPPLPHRRKRTLGTGPYGKLSPPREELSLRKRFSPD